MDLRTSYMGIELKNPLIASASPLSEQVDHIRRMEDAGAAAVVLFSLFEEQIRYETDALEYLLTHGGQPTEDAIALPRPEFKVDPESYLNLITNAVSVVDIPIIGSLNGASDEGWTEYARMIEQAGASGLELNVWHIPTDTQLSAAEVEAKYVYILESVKSTVRIPVAMKLSPYFSALPNMARQLDQADADALVLFNRFYQADIDLDSMRMQSSLHLSSSHETRLPLMWLAILHGRVQASLAASGGVQNAQDVLKYIVVGADAVMTASALMMNGIGHINTLLKDMTEWLENREHASLQAIKGAMSHQTLGFTEEDARDQFIRVLKGFDPNRVFATDES